MSIVVCMCNELLKPSQVDSLLRYPNGRSQRLARQGLIPHIALPDGEIRFDPEVIDKWISERSQPEKEPAHAT